MSHSNTSIILSGLSVDVLKMWTEAGNHSHLQSVFSDIFKSYL